MNRYVMRHPETGGTALIPESAVATHRAQGWLRVSEAIPEEQTHRVDPAGYADAPDLDAPPPDEAPAPEPQETPTPAAKPARTPKES